MEKQKQKPQLRFPNFKDEWEIKNLGDLLKFKNGINASKEQYGSGYKFINVLDILNNDFITHDNIIGSVDVDENTADKFSVSYGDILFQRSSETREEVGSASVYLDEEKKATFGGFVIRGKKIGEYEPTFLNRLMKTDLARNQITSKSGGSTRYNVGQELLSSINLFLPSIPEQRHIASFFAILDKKISELKQKKNLIEQHKKGVMQKLFSQELRFKDDNGKEFPKWKKEKLDAIISNFIVPMRDKPKELNGEIPWCRIEDFEGKYLAASKSGQGVSLKTVKEMNLKVYPVNTLLVSCSANLGFCAIVKTELITNQTFIGLVPDKNKVNVEYLYYIMILSAQRLNVLSSGTTISYLSRVQFEKFEINIPSIQEQTKIANFLSAIDEKINRTENQIQQTQQYKKGLLQQMFV
jgi:type I restriction enzyme S subunit